MQPNEGPTLYGTTSLTRRRSPKFAAVAVTVAVRPARSDSAVYRFDSYRTRNFEFKIWRRERDSNPRGLAP